MMYKSTSARILKLDDEDYEDVIIAASDERFRGAGGVQLLHGVGGGDSDYHHEWTYQIDLQLAAELGKTLLQRNKDLEHDLAGFQDHAEDQALEIDFLNKQVQLLRDESATRLAACDMLDTQLQELKRSESGLQEMRNLDYMRITRLQDTVEVLQTRCDELQSQVTEIKRKKWEDKFATQSTLNATQNGTTTGLGMTRSITLDHALNPTGKRNGKDESSSDDETEPEKNILKEKIKVLQRQVADERKQRQLLQDQVTNVLADNTSLWSQLNQVTNDATVWREKLELLSVKYAEEIAAFNEARNTQSADNDDICLPPFPPAPDVPQLSILDEIADSLRDRFLDDLRREQDDRATPEPVGVPSAVPDVPTKCKTTQTDTGLIIEYLASRSADPTSGRFERGPPEYKKLFKEIFDIIKKSQEEETLRGAHVPRARTAKPKKQLIFYHNHF